ncbi:MULTISPECIES: DEAD/DEAH box helicase [unclassified Pseudomonas]|uniref:DEAD/DEAH box helicase n=3 Tax=Pseudomonas TaxID=286 RepID=UPI002AC9AD99|nr:MULTISPECIES: DEAD/DEAH box helicase [unclassified Pseudomonas]MEB0043382.1 DEAD/DEAH box helicase [Pseudomonas sp. MH10]MEB0076719.1 DEAD/DEAH box helicase [Pseudomonas sp. MH10out]MEB0090349.1 DEAD/DEAH box helicase [Pseudomonas sp. CCI4.2]MEB0120752.1 DEAD/DEAH box helicase [Pseudomonas sp. CCI1.2]MEB0131161.1 DEAD/DEAH box helicase [Pseudomonas sp. CCI2.4]
MTFATLGLIEPLLRAVTALGYQTPTPVQAEAIPPVLAGRDLMAAAQTGTGKTAGFALPLLQRLTMEGPKVAANSVRALVLVPTRELAEQVHANIEQYNENLPLKTYAVYGGVSINPQMMKLRSGVDVLVATPGRLLDLYRQKALKFNQLQILVLDEADRMLDLGFSEELRDIYAALPKRRQTLLFSATFSDAIRQLAGQMLDDPLTIEVSPRNVAASSVKQWVVPVDKKRKTELFIHLLKKQHWGQVLVFAKTRIGVDQLVERLQGLGINADGIHGDKPQATRQRALDRFKTSEVKILVATDVAARGLDIDDLPTVVNFDLPIVAEDYIHRIGRTGRAGLTGEAISFVCADEVELLSAIETLTRQTLDRQEEQDFEPEHRVPATDASGQILKKPKKPKKPKVPGGAKRNLGKWVDSNEKAADIPAVKAVRKVPVFNTGPRKKKP